jgi:hypothetical protein
MIYLMNFQLFEKMLMQMFKTNLIVDDLQCYNDVIFIISFHKRHLIFYPYHHIYSQVVDVTLSQLLQNKIKGYKSHKSLNFNI